LLEVVAKLFLASPFFRRGIEGVGSFDFELKENPK